MSRDVRRWPLALIAAPAAVSIWSGWVGLGQLSGFGVIHPLPGIADTFRINTAITLPVGVEAYGAYALGAWLSLPADHPARAFARRSAIGSLVLGMLGQVAYHLLAAAHQARAPWPVVVLVACLPVVTLGFGAALTHLLRAGHVPPDLTGEAADVAGHLAAGLAALAAELRAGLAVAAAAAPEPVPAREPLGFAVPEPPAHLNGHAHAAVEAFAPTLRRGYFPSIRAIRSELSVGQDRAQAVQAYLRPIAQAQRPAGADSSPEGGQE